MKFDYMYATEEEMFEHVSTAPSSAVSVARRYHLNKGNTYVVDNIDVCRRRLKKAKLMKQLEELTSEVENDSNRYPT